MKKIFKPNISKIVIFLILITLTAFLLPHSSEICSNTPTGIKCGTVSTTGIGYPVFFGEQFYGDAGMLSFSFINLLVNIIIFYPISCLIILPFTKLKEKTKISP